MRLIILVFLPWLLAGCETGSLARLAEKNPEANNFESALAAEYLAYATSESTQGRAESAEYFAAKGLRAASGERLAPEAPSQALPASLQEKIAARRALLVALMSEDVRRVMPQPAARAQILFDCWASASARDGAIAEICEEEMDAALETLEPVAASFGQVHEKRVALSFAQSTSELSAAQRARLRAAAGHAVGGPYRVVISGAHTTSAGRKLFQRRADSIRRALIASGLVDERIAVKSAQASKTVRLSSDRARRAKTDSVDVELTFFSGGEKNP